MLNGWNLHNSKEVFEDNFRYFDKKEPAIKDVPLNTLSEQTKYSTDWFGAILNNNAPYWMPT
jgi:hypothetical protein